MKPLNLNAHLDQLKRIRNELGAINPMDRPTQVSTAQRILRLTIKNVRAALPPVPQPMPNSELRR